MNFKWLLNSEFVQSLIKYALLFLAAIGLIKTIRKDAADDKENEVKLEQADIELELIKQDKERDKNIDGLTDSDKRERLQSFFKKD